MLTEKLDLGLAEENRIGGRERNRAVDAEDRNLERVARLDLLRKHDSIWHVETLNRGRTWSSGPARHLAIDPRFGVIVNRERQHRRRAGRVELPDLRGHRQAGAKPCHEQMAATAPFEQALGLDRRP